MCERAKIYKEKIVVARVKHKCCECDRTIIEGDRYVQINGLWEDCWGNFKYCEKCIQVKEWFENKYEPDCLEIGSVYQELINSDVLVWHDGEDSYWESEDDEIVIVSQNPLRIELSGGAIA